MRGRLGIAWLAAAVFTVAPGASSPSTPPASGSLPPRHDPLDSALWISMRNVHLRLGEQNYVDVRSLRGQVLTDPGVIAFLDEPPSYRIRVTSGTVGLRGEDLAWLLNNRVFNYPGSPLRDLKVRTSGPFIVQSGVMHKGVDLPFEMTAALSVDPDGRVRSHPVRMRMLGVDGLKLLHALGLHLDKALDLKGAHGAAVDGDDILLDPVRMLPPPEVLGRLASIRVQGNEIMQEFVPSPDDSVVLGFALPDPTARNYVYFHGGRLRFGKLTMHDTDLLIGDADERDPFDLWLVRYNRQLVAGYTHNLHNFGLRVYMADYSTLPREPITPPTAHAP